MDSSNRNRVNNSMDKKKLKYLELSELISAEKKRRKLLEGQMNEITVETSKNIDKGVKRKPYGSVKRSTNKKVTMKPAAKKRAAKKNEAYESFERFVNRYIYNFKITDIVAKNLGPSKLPGLSEDHEDSLLFAFGSYNKNQQRQHCQSIVMATIEATAAGFTTPIPTEIGNSTTTTTTTETAAKYNTVSDIVLHHLLNHYSKLYFDVTKRLCLPYQLDFSRKAVIDQTISLSFIELEDSTDIFEVTGNTLDKLLAKHYPGALIFNLLIETVLSIESSKPNETKATIQECINTFMTIMIMQPPFTVELRKIYDEFLKQNFQLRSIIINKSDSRKSQQILDILLDLIEDIINELSNIHTERTDLEGNKMNDDNYMLLEYLDISLEIPYNEAGVDYGLRSYYKLTLEERLKRIQIVLEMLLSILELDFAFWFSRNTRTASETIFKEDGPLAVNALGLCEQSCVSIRMLRMMKAFAMCIGKCVDHKFIQILERFISMNGAVCSIKGNQYLSDSIIQYPIFSQQTKYFVNHIYTIFKFCNVNDIAAYQLAVDTLRVPYIRFQFINNMLGEGEGQFIIRNAFYDIYKCRYLRGYTKSSTFTWNVTTLTKEMYLILLLEAVSSYCKWHKLFKLCKTISNDMSLIRYHTNHLPDLYFNRVCEDSFNLFLNNSFLRRFRKDFQYLINLSKIIPTQKHFPRNIAEIWMTFLKDYVYHENNIPIFHYYY